MGVRSKPPLGRKALRLVQVNKWMSISKLAMMDLLVGDWVPHGGLPTCLTIPNEFRPRSIQCDDNPVNTRISRGWQLPQPVQLVCLILAFSLLVEPIIARPMYGRHRARRGPKPKWVNPCGIDPALVKKNALVHADDFKEKFVQSTFSSRSWEEHHETWKEHRYEWLPSWQEIPKHLHEALATPHLSKLKLDSALKRMYNYLQRFAVGLEVMVEDQAMYDGDFIMEFNEAEYKLKAVLCELQMAMLERGLEVGEDVDRSIMSKEVRNTEDSSYRNLRDWYIYRDYMNGLEYVIHAFAHLKKHHQ